MAVMMQGSSVGGTKVSAGGAGRLCPAGREQKKSVGGDVSVVAEKRKGSPSLSVARKLYGDGDSVGAKGGKTRPRALYGPREVAKPKVQPPPAPSAVPANNSNLPSLQGVNDNDSQPSNPSRKRPRKQPITARNNDVVDGGASHVARQKEGYSRKGVHKKVVHRNVKLSPLETNPGSRTKTNRSSLDSTIFGRLEQVPQHSKVTALQMEHVDTAVRRKPEVMSTDGKLMAKMGARSVADVASTASFASLPISYTDAQAVFQDRSDSDELSPDDGVTISSLATQETLDFESECSTSAVRVANAELPAHRARARGSRRRRRRKGGLHRDIKGNHRRDNVHRSARKLSCGIDDYWSLSPRERKRQMRHMVLAERTGAAGALELLMKKVEGCSMRSRDLFNVMDHDRDNILTRAEIHHELATLGLVLDEENLSSLMTFLDIEDRGYVTFGDLNDGLKMFRKFKSLPRAAEALAGALNEQRKPNSTSSCPRRPPRTRLSRVSTTSRQLSVGRLETALLTPLPLITTPPPLQKASKKRRRPVNIIDGTCRNERRRVMGWGTRIRPLDITDPEIDCLADCLMGVGDGGDVGRCKESQQARLETDAECQEWRVDVSHTDDSPCPSAEGNSAPAECKPQQPTNPCLNFSSNRDPEPVSADKTTDELLRPLFSVMSALKLAAGRECHDTNDDAAEQAEHVRGPGPAAVPCSAAKVCHVLSHLERLWRECRRRHPHRNVHHIPHGNSIDSPAVGVSDEELDTAVRFFDTDSTGHVRLDDVVGVFRSVQGERVARRRPPFTAVPTLLAVGRRLDNRGLSAATFVQQATTPTPASGSSKAGNANTARGPLRSTKAKYVSSMQAGGRPATTVQMEKLLRTEMPDLTEEQRHLVLQCVEEDGLIWGVHLASAVRRARQEVAQRRHEQRLQKRNWRAAHGAESGTKIESEESAMDGDAASRPGAACFKANRFFAGRGAVLSPPRQRCSLSKQAISGSDFNHLDAALLLSFFIRESAGLRTVNVETTVASWLSLKRRDHGAKTYRAGRSAARGLRRLLHQRSMKPLRWFKTLHHDNDRTTNNEIDGRALRVPVSAFMVGVHNLLAVEATNLAKAVGGGPGEAHNDQARTIAKTAVSEQDKGAAAGQRAEEENGEKERWNTKRLAALVVHLDPCGDGALTTAGFREGLRDCYEGLNVAYPDASHLASARRFEDALRAMGCKDVCGLLANIVGAGRGIHGLIEYFERVGDCCSRPRAALELELAAREERIARALAARELEVRGVSERTSSMREKLARPENAGVVNTIRRIDKIVAAQGKRLVVELHQADKDGSGGIDRSELRRAVENLVRPCHSLVFERKRKREREVVAAAVAEREEAGRIKFLEIMANLHNSKAAHFLDAVSHEIRRRRLQIRDVFRNVDVGRSGALGVDDLLANAQRAMGLTLERSEAAALVSILDNNGDAAIQCEELEFALRSYRRYRWEKTRAQCPRPKPFHEEFPSIVSLFRRHHTTNPERVYPLSGTVANGVSRDDVVAALKRLRGDSHRAQRRLQRSMERHKSQQQHEQIDQRRLTDALIRIGQSCDAAGVRSESALVATLVLFDVGPTAVENRGQATGMLRSRSEGGGRILRDVDVRQWLQLMTPPTTTASAQDDKNLPRVNPGDLENTFRPRKQTSSVGVRISGPDRGGDEGIDRDDVESGANVSKAKRLLDREDIRLVLQAIAHRPCFGGKLFGRGDRGGAWNIIGGAAADARKAKGGVFFVSVSKLWKLLCSHSHVMREYDEREKKEASLRAIEVELPARKEKAINDREEFEKASAAALVVQGMARQRQARKRVTDARIRRGIADAEREGAALSLQCAVRQRKATKRAQEAKDQRDITARQYAALTLQCATRRRQARARVGAIRVRHQDARVRKENAGLTLQCAVRQRQARNRVVIARTHRDTSTQQRENAAIAVQCALRQRQARARMVEAADMRKAQQQEYKQQANAAALRIQALERGRQSRTRAAAAEKAKLEDAARRVAAAAEERNVSRAAVNIQCTVRRRTARLEVSHLRREREEAARRRRREEQEITARAIQKAAERRRIANDEKHHAEAVGKIMESAAIDIQRVFRGWLAREELANAVEKAALDAAIAARRAQLAAAAASGGGTGAAATGWRKKSVVGGRGAAGTAHLSIVAREL